MQLERPVLGLVFEVVTHAHVHILVDLERVVDACVLDVLGAVVVKFVLVEPLGVLVGEQAPVGTFAKPEDVRLVALGCVLDVNLVRNSQIPESENVLLDAASEFTRVRKLVRGACTVEVFAHVLDMAIDAGLVDVPVERCANGEVLAAPVEPEYAVFVAVVFFVSLHFLCFADKRTEGVAHFAPAEGRVVAEDVCEFCIGKRVDAVLVLHQLAHGAVRNRSDSRVAEHLVDGALACYVGGVGTAHCNLSVKFDIAREE